MSNVVDYIGMILLQAHVGSKVNEEWSCQHKRVLVSGSSTSDAWPQFGANVQKMSQD